VRYKSETTAAFWHLYRRLPEDVKAAARVAYRTFRDNPSSPGLNFERLSSNRAFCSARINRQYRVAGIVEEDTVTWFWIGTHTEFDRRF
jgi:hypothetical protein